MLQPLSLCPSFGPYFHFPVAHAFVLHLSTGCPQTFPTVSLPWLLHPPDHLVLIHQLPPTVFISAQLHLTLPRLSMLLFAFASLPWKPGPIPVTEPFTPKSRTCIWNLYSKIQGLYSNPLTWNPGSVPEPLSLEIFACTWTLHIGTCACYWTLYRKSRDLYLKPLRWNPGPILYLNPLPWNLGSVPKVFYPGTCTCNSTLYPKTQDLYPNPLPWNPYLNSWPWNLGSQPEPVSLKPELVPNFFTLKTRTCTWTWTWTVYRKSRDLYLNPLSWNLYLYLYSYQALLLACLPICTFSQPYPCLPLDSQLLVF